MTFILLSVCLWNGLANSVFAQVRLEGFKMWANASLLVKVVCTYIYIYVVLCFFLSPLSIWVGFVGQSRLTYRVVITHSQTYTANPV